MDFIPFKLDSFNLSDLKSILYKYYYFENNPDVNIDLIQPWIMHIFDCNRVEIGEIPFILPYDTNSPEEDSELNDFINFIYNQIITGCTWWSEESSDYLSSYKNSKIFYININKIESI